jgi:hypothetical protein
MRVCFISHSAGRYGAELALLELLQGLKRLGVISLVLVPKKGPLLDVLDRLNIEWRIIEYPVWMSRPRWFAYRVARTLKMLFMSVKIAQEIKKWRADVVYTNTVVVGSGAFAARLAHLPHVWHSHESAYHNPSQKFDLGKRGVNYFMDRLSTSIIVTSRSVEQDYRPYFNLDKIRVIYQAVTPVDPIETHGLVVPRLFFQCVIVGSLHQWKGQDEADLSPIDTCRQGRQRAFAHHR